MASGTQNMTTYNARVVTGSDSAAYPAGALLVSGANRADDATGDTWLFLDSRGGTTNPWGIKHDQLNNKLQIFGSGTNSVWTRMNTGDTYILGKAGIGYDPETSGNAYKLYVNGNTYFDGNTTHNGIDYFANGTTYYIDNSGDSRLRYEYANAYVGYDTAGFVLSHAGSPWPYIRFDTRAGGSTYVTTDQTSWNELYAQVPAKRPSDNIYYTARFFFRSYSKTANTTTRLNYYEDYCLPEVSDGRTDSVRYNILTTKDMSFSITGNAETVSRATFGDSGHGEHNANNIASNGLYYYNSNGPAKDGANLFTTTDGAMYCQAYSTSWVGQIAQDYRNGALAVRGKNNGTWTTWYSIPKMIVESYPALLPPNNTNNWIKIGTANDSYGLLPSQAGESGSGHNYLGTSSWYWKYAYIDQIYGYLNGNISGNAATATKLGTNAGSSTSPVYFTGGKPSACAQPKSGAWFSSVPMIGSNGVMEIGKYIDFHTTNTSTNDYDARITATTTGLTLSGTTSGTFSGNVTGNCSGSSGSCTGNSATASALKDKTNGTSSYLNYGRTGITSASSFTWLCVWNGYNVEPASKGAVMEAVRGSASGSWSISITGNAATATALGTNAGSATVPIYFTGGKPHACSGMIKIQGASFSYSVKANSATTVSCSVSPGSGWKAIGLVRVSTANNNVVFRTVQEGSVIVRNLTSSAINGTLYVDWAFASSSIVS